jgi:hypothetical protein
MLRTLVALILISSYPNIAVAADIFDYTEEEVKNASPNDAISQNNTMGNDIFSPLDESKIKYVNQGKIIILNKITSNSKEFAIQVKDKITYGKAEVELHKCVKTEQDESILLVTLRELSLNKEKTIIFRGWLFSKNLSLSAVQHPVYQLIAVSCS